MVCAYLKNSKISAKKGLKSIEWSLREWKYVLYISLLFTQSTNQVIEFI